MYPNYYFNLFPPFPKNNRVFVAMSFNDEFEEIWKDIISKSIASIIYNGKNLEPFRIDLSITGDSIQTEMLRDISECRLFIADISTEGFLNKKAIRNGNVMYELGIAHAVRFPEEIIILRSDNDEILFDITNIRIHQYQKNDVGKAKLFIKNLIEKSLKEIDLQKHLSVQNALKKMDFQSWNTLTFCKEYKTMKHSPFKDTDLETKNSILKLLEMGLIEAIFNKIVPDENSDLEKLINEKMFLYTITPFGQAVINAWENQFNFDENDIKKMERFLNKHNNDNKS